MNPTHADAAAADAYAPHPLDADPIRFGLDTTTVSTGIGDIAVRSCLRRTGRTATVLLHGAAGSWSTWTPMLAEIEARNRHVADLVLPDLPGWGDSPLPAEADSRTVAAYAAAVAGLLRQLGYTDWHVVGHSLGGFIALELAAAEPRATLSVGLVSPTTFSVADAARQPLRNLRALPWFVGLLIVMRVFAPLGRAASQLLSRFREIGALRRVMAPLFRHPARVPTSVIDALAVEVRPAAFVRAAASAAAYPAVERWSRLRMPVRVVHGDRDVFVTADDDARLAAEIPDLTVTVLPDAGHFGHVESPAAVLDALAEVVHARP